MESARCKCPHDSEGVKCGRSPLCAIHGISGADPIKPWVLGWTDKRLLRSMRISPEDAAEIAAVREADEQRFKQKKR